MYSFMLSAQLKQIKCHNLLSYSSAVQGSRNLFLKPDIIVVDYNLLGPDDIEVLKLIKKESPTISIIILSEPYNYSVNNELREFKDLHYLTKEKDSTKLINILIQRINNIVETKEKKKNLAEQRMIIQLVCIVIIILSIILLVV